MARLCSIKGCERPHDARGYCPMHYSRWKVSGDPGEVEPRHRPLPPECIVDECSDAPIARGYCERHYYRVKRWGSPHPNRCEALGCDSTTWAGQQYCPKDGQRNYYLQNTYDITLEEFDVLLMSQCGSCAICGVTPERQGKRGEGSLHVDHDHDTGSIRGLLCIPCNRGIGLIKQPEHLLSAAHYLETA